MRGSVPLSSEPPYQEQLEANIEDLRKQLSDSQKQVALLREKFQELADNFIWNGDDHSYQHWVIEVAQEALAATADLDGLILCDAMPITWYDPMAKQFQLGTEPLYRAWGPK